jgi:predicted DNA-binding transcriptional regulator AlpA
MNDLLTPAQVAELMGIMEPPAATSAHEHNSDTPDLLHSGWYTTEEVADLIGVDASTLRRWRTATPPQGPPFVRLTSRVTMYSVPDVQAWLASRRIEPGKAA